MNDAFLFIYLETVAESVLKQSGIPATETLKHINHVTIEIIT